MKYDLSILIPARNEEFLQRTIEDILEKKEGKTEIIAGLDGYWPVPPIKDHPDVTLVHVSESLGQRAMTNQLARLSQAKYLMKIDAHCAFDKGFDRIMMADMKDDWTMVPIMRNLWAFDWKCRKCGIRTYQGTTPTKCDRCGGIEFKKRMVWKGKDNPQSTAYRFDKTMHFQYWNDWGKTQKGDITETLSIQGSCFMVTRDKYWELDLCSENFHSWGQQGVEVACKTWLSGGRVVINRKTWYAHMFRTKGGDFGFPYENPQSKIDENRALTRDLFFNNKWDKAIHPFSWLMKKFWPVPDWTQEDLDRLIALEKANE